MAGVDEVHALAEAVLEAADVAELGVTVSFDDGENVRYVYVSSAAARILGYAAEELLGQPMSVAFAPQESSRLAELAVRWRRGESIASQIETAGVRKTGELVPIEVAFSVVRLAGEPAMVAFLRDIAERKAAEARLAFTDRMATLGKLAAGVAHEINNPIGYVTLNLESLSRELAKLHADAVPQVASALTSAREGLERMASIVRDLLGLSAGGSAERWPVDVRNVLDSAVNVAMHAIRGHARLARRYGDVPPLRTDPARLGQVFLNLLFNAVQSFPDPNEERNEISLEIANPEPEIVTIRISDNGCGIEELPLERIFEPFYTTKAAGTGLGLAICQNLIASLGGCIEVKSNVGVGSAFTVKLRTPSSSQRVTWQEDGRG